MKFLVSSLLLLLCVSTNPHASNGDPGNNDPGKKAKSSATNLSNVFFEDYSSGAIFIDFEGLVEPLSAISILKGDQLLFSDSVEDLPLNAIYELNTDLMRPGVYTIELETIMGVKVVKDIRVE